MFFVKSYFFFKNMKILTASPFETLFHPLKFTKHHNNNNKKYNFDKQAFSLERCRKNRFWRSHAAWDSFFDCHAAWERDFSLLRHLPSENVIFSFFQHVPSEKLKNIENRIMESCCGRVGAKDAKCKSPQKSILAPKDMIGTHFKFLHKQQFNNSIHNC